MGIYDRDWYKDSAHPPNWFTDLPLAMKLLLVGFVATLVWLFILREQRGNDPFRDGDIEDGTQVADFRKGRGSIHEAAEAGDVGRVAEILTADPSQVQAIRSKECPDQPLHLAAFEGQRGVADLLLRFGADVNARGDHGATPLHLAARSGRYEVIELLLRRGADVKAVDHAGFTPLFVVARIQAPERGAIADLLMRHGAELELHSAISLGRAEKALSMLQNNPHAVTNAMFKDDLLGSTIVMIHGASSNQAGSVQRNRTDSLQPDHRELLEMLLAQGADIDHGGVLGGPPLCEACRVDEVACAEFLLDHGADPHVTDGAGRTPLQLALGPPAHKWMVELLRKRGASK